MCNQNRTMMLLYTRKQVITFQSDIRTCIYIYLLLEWNVDVPKSLYFKGPKLVWPNVVSSIQPFMRFCIVLKTKLCTFILFLYRNLHGDTQRDYGNSPNFYQTSTTLHKPLWLMMIKFYLFQFRRYQKYLLEECQAFCLMVLMLYTFLL